jgi:hypothetical protein
MWKSIPGKKIASENAPEAVPLIQKVIRMCHTPCRIPTTSAVVKAL